MARSRTSARKPVKAGARATKAAPNKAKPKKKAAPKQAKPKTAATAKPKAATATKPKAAAKTKAAAKPKTTAKPKAAAKTTKPKTAAKPKAATRATFVGREDVSSGVPTLPQTQSSTGAVVHIVDAEHPIATLRAFLDHHPGELTVQQGQIALGAAQLMLLPFARFARDPVDRHGGV